MHRTSLFVCLQLAPSKSSSYWIFLPFFSSARYFIFSTHLHLHTCDDHSFVSVFFVVTKSSLSKFSFTSSHISHAPLLHTIMIYLLSYTSSYAQLMHLRYTPSYTSLSVVQFALQRKQRWGLSNVHFLSVNANIDLPRILTVSIPQCATSHHITPHPYHTTSHTTTSHHTTPHNTT